MAQLTINTIDLVGDAIPYASFKICVVRPSAAAGAIISGTAGVVSQPALSGITDDQGVAVVNLAATTDYSVQTEYEFILGNYSARFTLTEDDAFLHDRLLAEAVIATPSAAGVSQSELDAAISDVFVDATLTDTNLLTLIREDGEDPRELRLPVVMGGGSEADGVVQSASLNAATGIATLTLSIGAAVSLDLSALLNPTALTGDNIVSLLEALQDANRLSASAIRDLITPAPWAADGSLLTVPPANLPTSEGTAANLYAQSWIVPSDAFTPERISGPLVAETQAPVGATGNGCYRAVFSDTDADLQTLTLRLWDNQIINGSVKAGQTNIFDMGGAIEVETNDSAAVIISRRFRLKRAGAENFGPYIDGGSFVEDLDANQAHAFQLSAFNNTAIALEGLLLGEGDEHESVFDLQLVEHGHRIGTGAIPTPESGSLRYCFIRGYARLYTPNERFGLGQAISVNAQHFLGDGTDTTPLMLVNPFTTAHRDKLEAIEDNATRDQTGGEIVSLLEALTGSNKLDYSALDGRPDLSDFFTNAAINGGVLTFTQQDGSTINLTLPTTGGGMADGVISSATIDNATKIVSLTTSNGDVISLNLSALALRTEIAPWARDGSSVPIPAADLDDPFPRNLTEQEDAPTAAGYVQIADNGTWFSGAAPSTGGSSSFAGLTDTPDDLGTPLYLWRTDADGNLLDQIPPSDVGIQASGIRAIFNTDTEDFAKVGNSATVPPEKLPMRSGAITSSLLLDTTYDGIDESTSRGFADDWIIPDEGIFYVAFETASGNGMVNTNTDYFDAAEMLALTAIPVSGNPIQSSTGLNSSNTKSVRAMFQVAGNQAFSLGLSRDSNNRLLIRPGHRSFPFTTILRARIYSLSVVVPVAMGTGDSDGGGATGQANDNILTTFDVITGPSIVKDINTQTLFANADGSLQQQQLYGDIDDPVNVPIIHSGNVLRLRIEGQEVSADSPPMDLYMILGDGTFLSLNAQFPRTGETLDLEISSNASNGMQWVLGYSFTGTEDFVITGGSIIATVIRYHERFFALTPRSPVASAIQAGWRYDFPVPVDPVVIESIYIEMSNTEDNYSTYWQEIPTGLGDVDVIQTHPEDSPPTNPYGDDIYAILHNPGQPPFVLLKTRAYHTESYMTFAFLRNAVGSIVGVQGIGVADAGISWTDDDDIRFRMWGKRRI